MEAFKKLYYSIVPRPSIEQSLNEFIVEYCERSMDKRDTQALLKVIQSALHLKKTTHQELVKVLERIINNNLNWKTALKFLEVVHILIFELSLPFTEEYKHNKLKNLSNFKTNQNNIKDLVHLNLINYYSVYLLRLSFNLDTIYFCFQNQKSLDNAKTPEHLLGRKEILSILFKVSNLLKYLLRIQHLLQKALWDFKEVNLNKSVTLLILKDCVDLYSFLKKYVDYFLVEFKYLPKLDALQLYEIYCELIQQTKQMESFFKLLRLIHKNHNMNPPNYLYVEKEKNKEIELFLNNLKKNFDEDFKKKSLGRDSLLKSKTVGSKRKTEDQDDNQPFNLRKTVTHAPLRDQSRGSIPNQLILKNRKVSGETAPDEGSRILDSCFGSKVLTNSIDSALHKIPEEDLLQLQSEYMISNKKLVEKDNDWDDSLEESKNIDLAQEEEIEIKKTNLKDIVLNSEEWDDEEGAPGSKSGVETTSNVNTKADTKNGKKISRVSIEKNVEEHQILNEVVLSNNNRKCEDQSKEGEDEQPGICSFEPFD